MKRCVYLLLTLAASTAFCEDTNIVFHDDFEAASTTSPPPGWAMWGAEQYKTPANYTRDTTSPHSGQACFRIHHPANTAGYIVSSPYRAINPKPGMVYVVTFWARAEKPGKATFRWTAYRSIKRFVDAPSPGTFGFEAGREWKEFSFTVREGLDFFADQSPFLLLTFIAATELGEERTLWIDDVRVSESPDPQPAHLVNGDVIPHDPLQHRLGPGDQLEFTVDTTKRLRRANQDVGGVSFHRVCGWTGEPYNGKGDYTLMPEMETAIREMRLPMTRFYALGDEPFGTELAMDKVAELLRRIGVAEDRCVLEFERQGAETKLPPETWARGVAHSLRHG